MQEMENQLTFFSFGLFVGFALEAVLSKVTLGLCFLSEYPRSALLTITTNDYRITDTLHQPTVLVIFADDVIINSLARGFVYKFHFFHPSNSLYDRVTITTDTIGVKASIA